MLVAVLNAQGVIKQIEDISEKGLAEGYRPLNSVDAQPEWEEGGKVVSGVYTPPAPKDFSTIDNDEINAMLLLPGSVVRALATVLFKDMKTRTPALTVAQFKALLKAEMR